MSESRETKFNGKFSRTLNAIMEGEFYPLDRERNSSYTTDWGECRELAKTLMEVRAEKARCTQEMSKLVHDARLKVIQEEENATLAEKELASLKRKQQPSRKSRGVQIGGGLYNVKTVTSGKQSRQPNNTCEEIIFEENKAPAGQTRKGGQAKIRKKIPLCVTTIEVEKQETQQIGKRECLQRQAKLVTNNAVLEDAQPRSTEASPQKKRITRKKCSTRF